MIQLSKDNYKKPYIGIIILDTKFQRILGDIGNSKTWKFPVIYRLMKEIYPNKIVNQKDFRTSIMAMAIRTARELEEVGVDAITTTCGFLAKYQKEISNNVSVPVFTSSLLQIPMIYQILNQEKKIAVITANSKTLTGEILSCVGIKNIPLIVTGMENKNYFQKVFVSNQLVNFSRDRIKNEIIETVIDLINFHHDEIGAILLECTNMSPYAHDVQETINLPVFDICSLMNWVYSGLKKEIFY